MRHETLNRPFPEVWKQDGAYGPMLLGVERGDWRARPEAALKLGRKLAGRGEVAYWVALPEGRPPESKRANNRAHARKRKRLCSAKLLDGSYRFVCEGRICDQSRDGLRLATCSRHCASTPIGGAHRRNIRSARGEGHLAARVDNRNSTALSHASERADCKPKVCTTGTLLRDSRLSPFTYNFSLRPRPNG